MPTMPLIEDIISIRRPTHNFVLISKTHLFFLFRDKYSDLERRITNYIVTEFYIIISKCPGWDTVTIIYIESFNITQSSTNTQYTHTYWSFSKHFNFFHTSSSVKVLLNWPFYRPSSIWLKFSFTALTRLPTHTYLINLIYAFIK